MKTFRIPVLIMLGLLVSNNSYAQEIQEEYWTLSAHFRITSIKKIHAKYLSEEERSKEGKNKQCYHITVELMDTDNFQQMAYIYGNKKTFKGTKFSIISVDSGFACNNSLIRKKDIVFLTISLWTRIWHVGDLLTHNSLWCYEVCGYYIPYKKLSSQPMKAKELKGLCYSFSCNETKPLVFPSATTEKSAKNGGYN